MSELTWRGMTFRRPAPGIVIDITTPCRHGVFCGWEIPCLGRTAAGERFSNGQLDLATRIESDGRPLWIERGSLRVGSSWLEAAAGLGG